MYMTVQSCNCYSFNFQHFGVYARRWNVGSYGDSMFIFFQNIYAISIVTATFYIFTSNVQGFPCIYIFSNTCYFLFLFDYRRRQWHPTPVLLPEKSHGWRSLEGCSPWGRWGSDMTERLHFHFLLSCIGEGNGNPLQCSCLENPRDGGAWWAAVYGAAQGRTWLKRLSTSTSKGEGNGNPLQRSCLENPIDRGAWQAIVHAGVTRVGHDLVHCLSLKDT